MGSQLLVDVLSASGLPGAEPQAGEPTYADEDRPGRARAPSGTGRPIELDRVVRLDRAFTTFRDRRLRVLGGRGP